MKNKLILLLASLGVITLSGCSQVRPLPSLGPLNAPVANVSLTPAQAKTEARILGTLIALNKDESSIAALAERKALNPAVKNYAAWLLRGHTQDLQETQNVSQRLGLVPENGKAAMMLERKGKYVYASLNRLNGQMFDKTFIHDIIKGHVAALHLIDKKLLPATSSPLLKRYLENLRMMVADHLQRAKAIQQQMEVAR